MCASLQVYWLWLSYPTLTVSYPDVGSSFSLFNLFVGIMFTGVALRGVAERAPVQGFHEDCEGLLLLLLLGDHSHHVRVHVPGGSKGPGGSHCGL